MSKDIIYNYICTVCNHEAYTKKNPEICPNCGADSEYIEIDAIELE